MYCSLLRTTMVEPLSALLITMSVLFMRVFEWLSFSFMESILGCLCVVQLDRI